MAAAGDCDEVAVGEAVAVGAVVDVAELAAAGAGDDVWAAEAVLAGAAADVVAGAVAEAGGVVVGAELDDPVVGDAEDEVLVGEVVGDVSEVVAADVVVVSPVVVVAVSLGGATAGTNSAADGGTV